MFEAPPSSVPAPPICPAHTSHITRCQHAPTAADGSPSSHNTGTCHTNGNSSVHFHYTCIHYQRLWQMCVYMCEYIHVCVCAYMYVCVCVCVHVCVCTRVCTCVCVDELSHLVGNAEHLRARLLVSQTTCTPGVCPDS